MTHPTDEELDALVKRATVIDPLLEVDFDTQRDVKQDPYGAWEAIETALYLIRDQTAAITALRAQLAEVRVELHGPIKHLSEQDYSNVIAHLSPELEPNAELPNRNSLMMALVEATNAARKDAARADRAEAALAAQIEADAGIADSHNYGFMLMTDADMRAATIAHAIRARPHDRTALDRMLRAEREKALREAAEVIRRIADGYDAGGDKAIACGLYLTEGNVLALIEQDSK